jgi:hypothetical protein
MRRQDKTRQDMARHDTTRRDKKRQEKTKQDKVRLLTLIAGFPDLMPWIWGLLFLWEYFSPSAKIRQREHKRQDNTT